MKKESGFTLIELMVVVAIIAILAIIAYPTYVDSVRKSNRRAAQGFLMDLATRQNQFLLDRREYAPDLASLSVVTPDDVSRHYALAFTLVEGPPPSFTLTATPTSSLQTPDGALTINSAGAKTPVSKW